MWISSVSCIGYIVSNLSLPKGDSCQKKAQLRETEFFRKNSVSSHNSLRRANGKNKKAGGHEDEKNESEKGRKRGSGFRSRVL